MKVEINNREIEVNDSITTLAQLLAHEGLDVPGMAVAINSSVISRSEWNNCPLTDGLNIIVIKAVCGG